MSGNVIKGSRQLNYLLVEGPDDAQVFFHLLRHYQLEKHINIEKKEGIHQLLDDLDVELDRSGLGRLGIVVDADTDIVARWRSLRDRLMKLGYSTIPLCLQARTLFFQEHGTIALRPVQQRFR